MTPLFQKMVSNLLQALKVLFEDASTSLFDDFDDRRGRGALGGLEGEAAPSRWQAASERT